MLRMGLAGLGHGQSLLEANLSRNEHLPMRVTALCDVDAKRLETVATEYEIEGTTTNFCDLISLKEIDIVGIYTPGQLHAKQILAALGRRQAHHGD